jgi:hypothetical protein
MKLFGIETFGVRGLADAKHELASGPEEAHDLVVVTGPPASGKTRLLELIVAVRQLLAPTDTTIDQGPWVRPGNATARVVAWWSLSPGEQRLVGASSRLARTEIVFGDYDEESLDPALAFVFERYGHDDETPKVEYFASNRRLDLGGGEIDTSEETQKRFRGTKSPRKYAFLPGFLRRMDKATTARVAASLAALSASCRWVGGRLASRGRELGGLHELSGSESEALLFAATSAMLGLSGSIVLIDHPELHGRGALPLEGLRALGRDNQLVVAAHDPSFAAEHPHARIVLEAPADSRTQ